MNNKEIIIKHISIFALIVGTSYWIYSNNGEPYVGLISAIIQFIYLFFEIKNSKKDSLGGIDKKNNNYNFLNNKFNRNKGTIKIINNSSEKKEEKVKKVSKKEIKELRKKFLISIRLNELEKLKEEIEKKYSTPKIGYIWFESPEIRSIYQSTNKAINYIINNNKVILLLIGILIANLFMSIMNRLRKLKKDSLFRNYLDYNFEISVS